MDISDLLVRIRMRIREAQKHPDPDPQHCSEPSININGEFIWIEKIIDLQ